jgi:hypothetical protein
MTNPEGKKDYVRDIPLNSEVKLNTAIDSKTELKDFLFPKK